jgi:hypothetical protein
MADETDDTQRIRSRVNDIRKDMVDLPTDAKVFLAEKVLGDLPSARQKQIASEFAMSPEEMQYRQRWHSLLAGVGVMVITFIVLVMTMLLAPEFVDVVLPVVTTIVGAVVGFLFGGRQSSEPPTQPPPRQPS